jgi:arabinogalactan endo-1,4-beta-galactosidase
MKLMKIWGFLSLLFLLSPIYSNIFSREDYKNNLGAENDSVLFINGADLSFLPQIEDLGGKYYDEEGNPADAIQIFSDHGFNYIRLKLWHTPEDDYNNLTRIQYMAERIKSKNIKFLLNFHYSDTWADPGKQYKPAAWEGLSFEILKDSVYQYTKNVVQALDTQGTLPDMVQIGNEINPGMLWNDGRVGGSYDTPEQWAKLAALINQGIRGIRESCDSGDSIGIMIHIANAANNGGSRWFFDNITDQGVEFDYIGLSFYPWWHGTLEAVRDNLNDLALRYDKDIIIAEMAYPWTLQWYDNTGNIVGSSDQLHAGYPATVNGQTNFMRDLIKIVRNTRNQKGVGIFYWAPDWISVQPVGSSWENVTLFDFEAKVLSSMNVFLEKPVDLTPVQVTVRLNTATHWDTLQQHHFAQIRGNVSGNSYGTLPDGKEVTWDSNSDLILENVGGDYWETSFQMYPEDMLSFRFWTGYNVYQCTFLRLGWEGPIIPFGDYPDNYRIIVAGEKDSVINLQYYNSSGASVEQYWRPFESKDDSLAIYFRVNLGKEMASDRFEPDLNGPITVRGDPVISGGSLEWGQSKVILLREEYSVNTGSFWSGVCYIPVDAVQTGDMLAYKFYIENDSQNGWEDNISNRKFIFTQSFLEDQRDTTIHWVYFDEPDFVSQLDYNGQEVLSDFQLKQNYPNPFNQETRISYTLDRSTFVNLRVYDIHGRLITTLVKDHQSPGTYSYIWEAYAEDRTPLSSGIYLIILWTERTSDMYKILLLK